MSSCPLLTQSGNSAVARPCATSEQALSRSRPRAALAIRPRSDVRLRRAARMRCALPRMCARMAHAVPAFIWVMSANGGLNLMRKSYFLISACAFTLVGLSSAFAALPAPAYVDVKNGSNGNTGTGCAITTPCADLNHALSVLGTGGANVVIIVGGGIFGPVVLTQDIDIIGTDPNEYANIIADPTLAVGCIGHLPGSCAPRTTATPSNSPADQPMASD